MKPITNYTLIKHNHTLKLKSKAYFLILFFFFKDLISYFLNRNNEKRERE